MEEVQLICDEVAEEIIKVTEEIAKQDGAKNVTVRNVLKAMNITNRVFYNRFHNIDEVLERIYIQSVHKMRESMESSFDIRTEYRDYIQDVAIHVLINTYDVKMQFSQFMFELDSEKESNRHWWIEKIKEIIEVGKEIGAVKDVDSERLSHTIWSFFRGYNADAVGRNLSKEEAIQQFQFGLDCFLSGIMTDV